VIYIDIHLLFFICCCYSPIIASVFEWFWEVVGLEQCPFSLVSTIDEILERKSSSCCIKNREYSRRDPTRWSRGTLYPQKLALISPKGGGRKPRSILCSNNTGFQRWLRRKSPNLIFSYSLDNNQQSWLKHQHISLVRPKNRQGYLLPWQRFLLLALDSSRK
jgi:hypothetical protein